MGLSLLLPLLLLLLLTTLQAGNSARCDPKMDFRMDQPEHLSAPKGGTVHINFTFYYCGALAKDPRVSIALRRTHFHGEVIYNSTRHFVHEDYKDRIILNLPEGQKSGFLQILNLREEDENMYFCRVQLKTQRFGLQSVQSILGTKLTIYLGDPSKILRRSMRTLGFKDEAQDNGGILYASLTLSSSSSPVAHPPLSKMSPQEETLYSILKA
ncbi:paired immunoglobulin-like type 2 receptor alpha isoform X23 [Canis lupus familiaris]|uniref:paired immunoglobulin-like type 2 receptor alpha isoform X23 n=1 Tax=Canis lupus familiaris TaxID=9615 RepID=UPI0003AE0027|nr:paired immunoglobulin-like type 2 receptor alpha isoform X23 [Canis lupus familiaris]|eukprot:XP_005621121.1 paired immunoglobulin-like type 2 receptor alpha isoform X2 [Canis lupus familiaris]